MHKLIGQFDDKTLSLILILEASHKTSKDLYTKIKNYINNNMFLSFRRQSSKLRKILLSSVGDHLSKDDEQDILRADLFVDIEILKDISQLTYDRVSHLDHWLVNIQLHKSNKPTEEIVIKINKSDDLILDRKFTKHDSK
jgi:hypothetical protein